jgi:membrane associated rhomboid family serine protease
VADSREITHDDRVAGVVAVVAMAALMWLLEIVDQVAGGNLDQYGIEPRDPDALPAIVAAPFLHAGFDHLIGNTIPFLVLGCVIAMDGLRRVLLTTAIVMVVAGLGTWLIGPAHSVHIGASGVVFGYAGYLIARGIFSRSIVDLLVGAVVVILYSSTLLGALVPTEGISWQSHLFGAIGGVLAAWLLDRRPTAGRTPAHDTGGAGLR